MSQSAALDCEGSQAMFPRSAGNKPRFKVGGAEYDWDATKAMSLKR